MENESGSLKLPEGVNLVKDSSKICPCRWFGVANMGGFKTTRQIGRTVIFSQPKVRRNSESKLASGCLRAVSVLRLHRARKLTEKCVKTTPASGG